MQVINPSHGIGPDFSQSGKNGPSIFPTTSVGIRVKVQPIDAFYLQAVVLDGVPGDPHDPRGTHIRFDKGDGALMAMEAAYLTGTGEGVAAPYGKVALGAWHYTAKFDDVLNLDRFGNPVRRFGNQGIYALVERTLYREQGSPAQGLAIFGRYGIADSDINQFKGYLGVGAVYTGLIPVLDLDQMGLSVAMAHNGGKFKKAQRNAGTPVDSSEVVLEFTYRSQITPWLALQPDIQYIINPGTDPTVDDAFAIGIRFECSF